MTIVRPVESFVIESVKDTKLPTEVDGLPISKQELDAMLAYCPSVITLPESDLHKEYLPFNGETPEGGQYNLRRPSSIHGRSYQLIGEQYTEPWLDKFGNSYGALTLKGNNFSDPHIISSVTASEGYIAHGLQESTIIERTLRASEVLRARGIATEYILGLAEPKQLPWPVIDSETDATEYITLPEYKKRITEKYWRELSDDEQATLPYIELYSKFHDMAFYVSLRATDTAYRLLDMQHDSIRSQIYEQINAANPDMKPFDTSRSEDEDRYLIDIVCPKLGHHFAKLHTDLAHGFPHSGNITAFGGIVDLDSVHGEGLGIGDEPITMQDRARDITRILHELTTSTELVAVFGESQLKPQFSFLTQYINDTFKEFGGGQEAKNHLGELLVAIEDVIKKWNVDDTASPIWPHIMPHAMRVYADDILDLQFEDRLNFADRAVDEQDELNEDLSLSEKTMQRIEESIPQIAENIIGYNLMEISSHYNEMGSFNLPEFIFNNEMHFSQWRALAAKVAIDELSKRLAEKGSGISAIDSLRDSRVRFIMSEFLLENRYYDIVREAARTVSRKTFGEMKRKSNSHLDYSFPERMFNDGIQGIDTGFNERQFWHLGHEIPWQVVAERLSEDNIRVEYQNLLFIEDSDTKVVINASSKDANVTELLSDGFIGSHAIRSTNSNIRQIVAEFSQKPSYIAMIERNSDNEIFLRIFRPDTPEAVATPENQPDHQDSTNGGQLALF